MNLWAHFRELAAAYDEQPPFTDAELEGQSTTRRATRRLNERALIGLLRNWLLQDYVAAYCRSLAATRIFRRCYLVDALGLEARAALAPSTDAESQSPIAATGKNRKKVRGPIPPALQPITMLGDELAREARSIALYGLMLAAGSSRRKESRMETGTNSVNGATATDKIAIPSEGGILHASWLELAPVVLKEIEQVPALFLLNPLGPTLFNGEDLSQICNRAVPTELCLLLPHKQIEAHLRAALARPEQGASMSKLLRTDRWKTLPDIGEDYAAAIEGFSGLLSSSLQRHFQYPVQQLPFPVIVGAANVEDAPLTLLFATRRPDSLYAMNDAVTSQRRRIEEASYRGVLGESWFTEQQQTRYEHALNNLAERIRQQVQAQRRVRWPDLRQHLVLTYFGQLMLQDYDALVQRLLAEKTINCAWRQSAPEGEERRVPGNDDMLIGR